MFRDPPLDESAGGVCGWRPCTAIEAERLDAAGFDVGPIDWERVGRD